VDGIPASGLAEWDGTSWSVFSKLCINCTAIASTVYNGNLVVGGLIDSIDNVPYKSIAQWNGTNWSSIGSGINAGFGVQALAVYNGNLYAGGVFNLGIGNPNSIAMWNGSIWVALGNGLYNKGQSFNSAFKTGGAVFALAVYNGKLYAGGKFDSAGTVAATNLAVWDGATWSAVGTGFSDSTIGALAVFNNELYAGGFLGTYNNSIGVIDKWNGTSWSPVGSGFTGTIHNSSKVFSLCVYQSKLVAGGIFDSIGGIEANDIAYWNGTNWGIISFGIDGQVSTVGSYNSQLYAAGKFGLLGNAVPANNVTVCSGTLGINDVKTGSEEASLYPNPNNGIFQIQANSYQLMANSQIAVYNMLGEKIANSQWPSANSQIQINLSGHPAGVYLYRITSETGDLVSTGKFVIEK